MSMDVVPIIADSARKHGVSDEDMLHAYANPMIGANHAAIVFEIGVVDGNVAPVIVHAMRARDKFLR